MRGGEKVNALFIYLNRARTPKRGIARQKLIDQDAQRPPIDRGRVALALDDLRSQILGGAAQRVSFPFVMVNIMIDKCRIVNTKDTKTTTDALRPPELAEERKGCLTVTKSFREPEIHQLDMSFRVQQ
jgi:hypothetical protein